VVTICRLECSVLVCYVAEVVCVVCVVRECIECMVVVCA